MCADPVVDFKPEEIILPKNYNEVPLKHDLALIRLKRKVTYTGMFQKIDSCHLMNQTSVILLEF